MGWIWAAIIVVFLLLVVLASVVWTLDDLNKERSATVVDVLMDHKKHIETCMDGATDRDRWEAEAVRHGAARWTVGESGNRVFEWGDKSAAQSKGEHDDGR